MRSSTVHTYEVTDLYDSNQRKLLRLYEKFRPDDASFGFITKRLHRIQKIGLSGILLPLEIGRTDDGSVYYTRTYLPCPSFKSIKEELTPLECLRVLFELADTLRILHEHKFLHYRLHIDNIFVDLDTLRSGQFDRKCVWLCDFGLIPNQGLSLTSPFYLPPESRKLKQFDVRSEIYSFGLMGYLLFDSTKRDQEEYFDISEEGPDNSSFELPLLRNPQVPASVLSILYSCIQSDREFRPGSVREIEDVLFHELKYADIPVLPEMTFPFTGRNAELRFFSSKIADSAKNDQWAILLHGENGVGKTCLIEDFIGECKLSGKKVVKVTGKLFESLKQSIDLAPFLEESTRDLHEIIADALQQTIQISKCGVLVVYWDTQDQSSGDSFQLFKELLLFHTKLPVFWIIEAEQNLLSLETLSFSDRFIRRKLTPFTMVEVEEFFRNTLLSAVSTHDLQKTIVGHYGYNPGRIEHALRQLVRCKAITFDNGFWLINNQVVQNFIKSDKDLLGINLEELSPTSQALLEWMSIRNCLCSEEELQSAFAFDELQLARETQILYQTGLVRVSGRSFEIRYPAFRQAILSQLSEAKRKQLNSWVGYWLETSYEGSFTCEKRWEVAHHFYDSDTPHSFMRTMEVIFEKYEKESAPLLDPTLVDEAIRNEDSPLDTENKATGYRMLGNYFIRKKQYLPALEVFEISFSTPEFKKYISQNWLHLMLGVAKMNLSRYQEAEKHFQSILRSNLSELDDIKLAALRNMCSICTYTNDPKRGEQYLSRFAELIVRFPPGEAWIREHYRYGFLLATHQRYDEALIYFKRVIDSTCTTREEQLAKMYSYLEIAKINLQRGALKKTQKLIEEAETLAAYSTINQTTKFQFDELRLLVRVGLGQIDQLWQYIEPMAIRSHLYNSPSNQIRFLANFVKLYYYAGNYRRGMSLIRKAFDRMRRTSDYYMEPVFLCWTLNYFLMRDKFNEKLLLLVEKRAGEAKQFELVSSCNLLLAITYIDLKRPVDAYRVLSLALKIDANQTTFFPQEFYQVLRLRLEKVLNLENNESNGQFEAVIKSAANVVDPVDQGHFYRELMSLSIAHSNFNDAEKYFRLSCKRLKFLQLDWSVAQTLFQYGTALYPTRHSSRGVALIEEANRILARRGLASNRFETAKDKIIETNEEEEMNSLMIPLQTVTKIMDRLNKWEEPKSLTQQLLDGLVSNMPLNSMEYFVRTRENGNTNIFCEVSSGQIRHNEKLIRFISRSIENKETIFLATANDILSIVQSPEIASIFVLPVFSKDQSVGALVFQLQKDALPTPAFIQLFEVVSHLIGIIHTHVIQSDALQQTNGSISGTFYHKDGYRDIKGSAPSMQDVFHTLMLLKDQDLPVLILGESGTGKELIARIIHQESLRADKPFFALNCAAFQDTLIESLLFGHVKGSFSGAVSDTEGFFKRAEGGTVFLDEVNHMSETMQGKLLRILQEGEYYPVGSTKVMKSTARIICAAKSNLPLMVKMGQFREDLYYRINVIELVVPPLRERKEDIPQLVEHFIEKSNLQNKTSVRGIRQTALQTLLEYTWPGNVRQLENAIRHACMFTKKNGHIDKAQLPQEIKADREHAVPDEIQLSSQLAESECKIILQALENAKWNRSEAARTLGISRPTLLKKIQLHKLILPV